MAADVTTIEGCQAVVDEAGKQLASIDILVNNAGSSRFRPLELDDDEQWWSEAFALNFLAARRITDGVIASMQAQGWSRIINLTGAMTGSNSNAAGPAKAAL